MLMMFLFAAAAGWAGEDPVRTAVEKSLARLQSSGVEFGKKTGCISCHHQSLTAMAVSAARDRGFRAPAHRPREVVPIEREANRRIYSESIYPRIHLGWSELRSLVDSRFHYIEAPKPELYDVRADPQERRNIITDERRAYAAMVRSRSTPGTATMAPSSRTGRPWIARCW